MNARSIVTPLLLIAALALTFGCSPQSSSDGSKETQTSAVSTAEEQQQAQEILQGSGELLQQGKIDEALDTAAEAVRLAPDLQRSYQTISTWLLQLDRNELAIEFFDRFKDTHANALWYGARHRAVGEDRQGALVALDRCIDKFPAHPGCHSERAALRQVDGDFDGAIADLTIANRDSTDAEVAYRLAELLRVTGNYEEIGPIVREGLARDPRSVELLLAQARLQVRERDDALAERTLRNVLEIDPRSDVALRLLGGLVLRRGGDVEGAYLLQRADLFRDYRATRGSLIRSYSDTRDPLAALMAAEVELTIGEYQGAQQWIDLARAGGAPAARVAATQAWVHYALGDLAAGDAAMKSIDPANPYGALARAARAVRRNDESVARRWLRQAAAAAPNERSFLRRTADLYTALGDQDTADQLLSRATTAGFP